MELGEGKGTRDPARDEERAGAARSSSEEEALGSDESYGSVTRGGYNQSSDSARNTNKVHHHLF
jgi:hypothetical protein